VEGFRKKSFLKKKKISIKKKNNKNILIISNTEGLSILKNKGGLVM